MSEPLVSRCCARRLPGSWSRESGWCCRGSGKGVTATLDAPVHTTPLWTNRQLSSQNPPHQSMPRVVIDHAEHVLGHPVSEVVRPSGQGSVEAEDQLAESSVACWPVRRSTHCVLPAPAAAPPGRARPPPPHTAPRAWRRSPVTGRRLFPVSEISEDSRFRERFTKRRLVRRGGH